MCHTITVFTVKQGVNWEKSHFNRFVAIKSSSSTICAGSAETAVILHTDLYRVELSKPVTCVLTGVGRAAVNSTAEHTEFSHVYHTIIVVLPQTLNKVKGLEKHLKPWSATGFCFHVNVWLRQKALCVTVWYECIKLLYLCVCLCGELIEVQTGDSSERAFPMTAVLRLILRLNK